MKIVSIRLVKSLIGSSKNHIAIAESLGLKKIGDLVKQPDSAATQGKIRKIFHLVEVEY